MNISVTFTSCQEVEEFVSMFGDRTSCAKPDAAVAEKNAGLWSLQGRLRLWKRRYSLSQLHRRHLLSQQHRLYQLRRRYL